MDKRFQHVKWMMDARIGLFIHWGLYCINGVTEWKRSYERLSIEEYNILRNLIRLTLIRENGRRWLEKQGCGMRF